MGVLNEKRCKINPDLEESYDNDNISYISSITTQSGNNESVTHVVRCMSETVTGTATCIIRNDKMVINNKNKQLILDIFPI
jgi:hypothetical protein